MTIEAMIEQKPGEEIIEVVQASLIPLFPKLVLYFFWIVLPFFFLFPLFRAGAWGVLAFFLVLLSGVFFAVREWYQWNLTVCVITDRRVVDIDQQGFFNRVTSEVPYRNISDITYRIQGLIPTVFRYGVVGIQTLGNTVNLEIWDVRHPGKLHQLINDLREQSRHRPASKGDAESEPETELYEHLQQS